MKKYYPILLSKAGEFSALSHLSEEVRNNTSPVIQVLSGNLESTENFLVSNWSFAENQILLDFSLYDNLVENISNIQSFFTKLMSENIDAVPVIQQNSPEEYINFVRNYLAQNSKLVCIRASNDSGGFINFNEQIQEITTYLEITSSDIILLFDLAYVQTNNYTTLAALAILTLQTMLNINSNWNDIVVASGSFPENLTGFVAGNVYHLDRLEWRIWKVLQDNSVLKDVVKYSDYGTKNPIFADVNFAGTSSIKYTTENHFVIYRGELPQNHRRSMGQYIDQATILVNTPEYSGEDFSWGDRRINEIVSENNRPGNPRTWVEIGQNHHITLICSLL